MTLGQRFEVSVRSKGIFLSASLDLSEPMGPIWYEEGGETNFCHLLLLLDLLLPFALEVGLDLPLGSSLILGLHILLRSIISVLLVVLLLLGQR